MKPLFSRIGAGRAAVFVVALLLLVGGALAFKFLFKRPGESAIQLIPSDAMFVVTLDTTPSPAQTAVFTQIGEALKREGLMEQLDNVLTDILDKSPVGKEIRPYMTKSLAVAMLNQGAKNEMNDVQPVVLVALSDPAKVGELLAKYGQKRESDGLTYYMFRHEDTAATVIANYLVLSPKPSQLARIHAVHNNKATSMASLTEYQNARASLPEDANVMFFMAPTALKSLAGQGLVPGKENPFTTMDWLAVSATVRDKGIQFDYRFPMDSSKLAGLQDAGSIAPLDYSMLQKLPSGAYGLLAYSQPGKYWNSITTTFSSDPNLKTGFEDGLKAFEKETGMSVAQDLVPAMNGGMWLVVYPDTRGADKGADGLIVFDDTHGATPAALASKIRGYVERISTAHGGSEVRFQKEERGNATIWSLDAASETRMRDAVSESFNPPRTEYVPPSGGSLEFRDQSGNPVNPPGGDNSGSPNGDHFPSRQGGFDNNAPTGGDNFRSVDPSDNHSGSNLQLGTTQRENPMAKAVENKTIAYAQVGNAILIATSKDLLDRAISAYQGQGANLASDPAFAGMQKALPQGSQGVLMVNLTAIMQALKPSLEASMKDSGMGITADDIVGLFGTGDTGLTFGGKYDGKTTTMTFLLPLDYDKVIHVIGATTKQMVAPGPERTTSLLGFVNRLARQHGNRLHAPLRRDVRHALIAAR